MSIDSREGRSTIRRARAHVVALLVISIPAAAARAQETATPVAPRAPFQEEAIGTAAPTENAGQTPPVVGALVRSEPLPSAPPPSGDPAAGALRAPACVGCHGPDGNAIASAWPKLASQREDYLVKQLREFKAGRRIDPVMSAMAAPLSEQDMRNLAAHFSLQVVRPGSANPTLAARGERLYWLGRPGAQVPPCVGCHGPRAEGFGRSIDGGFPALGGQHAEYLVKQLQNFRSGVRSNDWEGVMRYAAKRLSDQDIQAVAAYLTTLTR